MKVINIGDDNSPGEHANQLVINRCEATSCKGMICTPGVPTLSLSSYTDTTV